MRDKTLAGKNAVFDVQILEASKRTLPELTDEFAEKVRSGLTKESLEAELRKAVDSEDAKEFVPARNAALAKALAETMDVEVPDTLVTNQAREKFALMMTDMRNNGVADEEIKKQINPENFLKYKNIVKDDIVKDFKVSMATDEIARMESIEVPDYQVEEQLEAIKKDAEQSGSADDFDEASIRPKVESTLQRNAVMDFLAEKSNLKVEFTSAEEEKFNEALFEQLAEESLAREQEMTNAAEAGESPVSNVEADVQAKAEDKESTTTAVTEESKSAAAGDRDYSTMSLEEKAYYSLLDAGALSDKDSDV